jgi:hypothetical protein
MTPEDRAYFATRAIEEERAAIEAQSDVARWRHEELALLYRTRAGTIRCKPGETMPEIPLALAAD